MADVRCYMCSEIYHETYKLFDPRELPNASMFKLKPQYGPEGGNPWPNFQTGCYEPELLSYISGEALSCAGCEAPLISMTGYVQLVNITDAEKDKWVDQMKAAGRSPAEIKLVLGFEPEPEKTVVVCPECSEQFDSEDNLTLHIEEEHVKPEPVEPVEEPQKSTQGRKQSRKEKKTRRVGI